MDRELSVTLYYNLSKNILCLWRETSDVDTKRNVSIFTTTQCTTKSESILIRASITLPDFLSMNRLNWGDLWKLNLFASSFIRCQLLDFTYQLIPSIHFLLAPVPSRPFVITKGLCCVLMNLLITYSIKSDQS